MKDITPRSEVDLHGAMKLMRPVEVTPELLVASTSDGQSVPPKTHMEVQRGSACWHHSLAPGTFAERATVPGRDSLSICLIVNPGWSRPVLTRVCRLLNHCVGVALRLFGRLIRCSQESQSPLYSDVLKRHGKRISALQFASNSVFSSEFYEKPS